MAVEGSGSDHDNLDEIVTTADLPVGQETEPEGESVGVVAETEGSADALAPAPEEGAEGEQEVAEEPEKEVAVEEPEKPEEAKLGSRATKRVQEAVNRAKDAESKMAEMQAQYQQQLAYMQYQMQQQMASQQAAMERQQEFYRKQAELVTQRQSFEDESKLTPAQKIEREWIKKAQAAAMEAFKPELEKTKAELAQERAYREQAIRASQERAMLQQYKQRADAVNQNVLFKGLDPTDIPKLSPKAQELLLTWGTAAGEEPEQAVQGFQQFLEDYHRARLKAVAAKGGAKIKQSQAAPKVVPNGKTSSVKGGPSVKYDFGSGRWVSTTT